MNGGPVRAVAEQVPVRAMSDSRPRVEGARLEIPDKLLKPTFPPLPYIALTSHIYQLPSSPWAGALDRFKRFQCWGPE